MLLFFFLLFYAFELLRVPFIKSMNVMANSSTESDKNSVPYNYFESCRTETDGGEIKSTGKFCMENRLK